MLNSNIIFQRLHIHLTLFFNKALLKYEIRTENFLIHEYVDQ